VGIPSDEGRRAVGMTWPAAVAVALLTNPGGIIGTVAPAFVNAFVAAGARVEDASKLAAAEFFAMATTLVLAPLLIDRFDRRLLAGAAVIAAAAGQFLSLNAGILEPGIYYRLLAGGGEGISFAVAIASLASAPSASRAFGLAILSNQVAGLLLLAIIAWAATNSPAHAALVVAGTFIAAHLAFIPPLPRPVQTSGACSSATGGTPVALVPVICSLAAMFLLSGGFGAVWPLIGQIGVTAGVSEHAVVSTLAVVGFGGIFGGLIATLVSSRLGRRGAVLLGTCGMAISIILTSTSFFAEAAILLMFFWAFSLPYFLGLLAELDQTGRLAVLSSAMIPFGIAGGQLVAGLVVAAIGLANITAIGVLAVAGALAAAIATSSWSCRLSGRIR